MIKELRAAQGQAAFPSGDAHYYSSPSGALKLGDIFHSNPQLVGEPERCLGEIVNAVGHCQRFSGAAASAMRSACECAR